MSRLPNDTPVWLLGPQGPGHRLTKDGRLTLCASPAARAVKTTAIAIHVYLKHNFCPKCFENQGSIQWP